MDIIDSFVVELGLDPRKYNEETRKFRADLKRTREDARRDAREIEDQTKRATEYFGRLKNEVLGIVAAVAGARSLGALFSDMIDGAAATGRLAINLGIATEQVSAWEGAVRSMGGTAQDAQNALALLNNEFQQRRLTGTFPHAAELAALGIPLNQIQDPNTLLMTLAERSQHMDRQQFVARMQGIGLPDSVINTLARGRQGVAALLEEQRRLGVVTERDAAAAIEFQRQWANLTTELKGDLRPVLTWLIETGLPFLHAHATEVTAAAAGLTVGIAALTFEIWAIPAAVAAAGAALVWLGDRFHALDAWRDFALHVQSLRIEGELLGIPDDSRDESIPLATRREHAAQRMRLLQQLQAIDEERFQISTRVEGGGAAPPMPGAGGAAGGGTSGPFSAIAARIRQTEGGRAGYDAVVYDIRGIIDNPTTRTLGDIYNRQPALTRATRGRRGPTDPGSSAIGAYQMVRGTLATAAEGVFGPGWRSQLFSPAAQDRMAQWLYEHHGLSPWAIGGGARLPNGSIARAGGARLAAGGAGAGWSVHIQHIAVNVPHGTPAAQMEAVGRGAGHAIRRNLAIQANTGLR